MDNSYNPDNAWRKVAAAIYSKPVDAKIFGTVELDVTDLEAWVMAKREAGIKATLMHPMILFVGRALKQDVPALNGFVRRGRVAQRPYVDAAVSVLLNNYGQMISLRVPDVDRCSLPDLVDFLNKAIPDLRREKAQKGEALQARLASIPWPFRGWLIRLLRIVVVEWGIPVPGLGISSRSFGSFVFSNIGSVGLDIGYAALLPASNVALVLTMGSVQTKPVFIDGQFVPRRLLHLSAVIDHRVADGLHAGQLFRSLKQAVRHPEVLDLPLSLHTETRDQNAV